MRRSYLVVKENNFDIYNNSLVENAESIIIDVLDVSIIFSNFEKFKETFNKFIENKTKIFIKVTDLKVLYKLANKIDFSYISGFYIKNPTKDVLRRLALKSREIESIYKLEYRSLKFLVVIDQQHNTSYLYNVIRNQRVDYVSINENFGDDFDYYQKKAKELTFLFHKVYINPSSLTDNINEIVKINEFNIPSINEINESLLFINKVKNATKRDQLTLLENNSLTYHYQNLKIAKKVGLIDDYPIIYYSRHNQKEKIVNQPIKIKKFYSLGEDIGNAISHGVGIALSIVAIILLLIKGGSTLELISYIVFGLSSLTLYTASTLYHSFRLGRKTKALFQKFDHISIYLLIAGTYTPFSLVLIGGTTGIYICMFLWIGALSGLLLNVFAFGRYRALHMILYVALGWVAVLFMPEITANLSKDGVLFLLLGGIMYTVGIIFYGLKLFKFTHMVWHIFTVLGTAAHFITILLYL